MKIKNILDDDFGFSTLVDEIPADEKLKAKVRELELYVDEMHTQYVDLEQLFITFLDKLKDNADKEYIFWPNREEKIEQIKQRIKDMK